MKGFLRVFLCFLILSFPSLIWGKEIAKRQEGQGKGQPLPHGSIITADVSPDGSMISAVVGEKVANALLFVFSKDGKALKITDGTITHCAWADNETLWFHKSEKDIPSIWEWRKGYPKPKLILKGALNPTPSPDGRWVACVHLTKVGDKSSALISDYLLIYDRSQKKSKKVSLAGPSPFLLNWSPDGKRLYALCFPPLSSSSIFDFYILSMQPPSFTPPKTVTTHSYPLAYIGSWGLEGGEVVFVMREGLASKFFRFMRYDERKGKSEMIWEEEWYNRSFAISSDGRFLLIPHERLDENNKPFFFLHLVDLPAQKEIKIENEDIKQGVGRVWYHNGLKGSCIVTPKKLFLLHGEGELKELLSL